MNLFNKMRVVNSYASDPETAARRHDILMRICERFLNPELDQNFPADYKSIDERFWFSDELPAKDEGEKAFRLTALAWAQRLGQEARSLLSEQNYKELQCRYDARRISILHGRAEIRESKYREKYIRLRQSLATAELTLSGDLALRHPQLSKAALELRTALESLPAVL